MIEEDKKTSEQLVRLVQIFFGIVLALGLGRYDDVVLHPFGKSHFLASCALFTILVTSILSWVDWHITMNLRPYNFSSKYANKLIHDMRLLSDIIIVVIYSYILLAIKSFEINPSGNISPFVWGFVFIFIGYIVSGTLRRIAYGSYASKIYLIICFGALYLLLAISYSLLASKNYSGQNIINFVTIFLIFILMLGYRYIRRLRRKGEESKKKSGLKIGLDIDGVLANQIKGILPRIRMKLGISITYDDITDWKLALGNSSIDKEIEIAMEDRDYILSMPAHNFARRAINALYRNNYIQVITGRPQPAETWTKLWLENLGIIVDNFKTAGEVKKSLYAIDLLVDDYNNNIIEYLANTVGRAILVDQPWNRNREGLSKYIANGRLKIIKSLEELPQIVSEIKQLAKKNHDLI